MTGTPNSKNIQSLRLWAGILGLVSAGLWLIYVVRTYTVISDSEYGFSWGYYFPSIVGALVLACGSVFFLLKQYSNLALGLVIGGFVVQDFLSQFASAIELGIGRFFYLEQLSWVPDSFSALGPIQTILSLFPFLSLVSGTAAVVLALLAQMQQLRETQVPLTADPVPSMNAAPSMNDAPASSSGVGQGWYRDPEGRPLDRYWDGTVWTEQTRPMSSGYQNNFAAPPIPVANKNGTGTAALVLGILGVTILPFIGPILAIIFGGMGISNVNRGTATNKGAAMSGLILGIVGLLFGLIYLSIATSS